MCGRLRAGRPGSHRDWHELGTRGVRGCLNMCAKKPHLWRGLDGPTEGGVLLPLLCGGSRRSRTFSPQLASDLLGQGLREEDGRDREGKGQEAEWAQWSAHHGSSCPCSWVLGMTVPDLAVVFFPESYLIRFETRSRLRLKTSLVLFVDNFWWFLRIQTTKKTYK